MTQQITITAGEIVLDAQLNDTETANAIAAALPITEQGNRWGGEIYFAIPVTCGPDPDARDILQPGELAYWPPGKAFCIFWAKTPASQAEEIRAASAVNIVGKITADLKNLNNIQDGTKIIIEKAK